MKNIIYLIMLISISVPFTTSSYTHDPNAEIYWHINPDIKSCSMELDSELTQADFKKFVRQCSLMGSFKSMASAKTLGKDRKSVV